MRLNEGAHLPLALRRTSWPSSTTSTDPAAVLSSWRAKADGACLMLLFLFSTLVRNQKATKAMMKAAPRLYHTGSGSPATLAEPTALSPPIDCDAFVSSKQRR